MSDQTENTGNVNPGESRGVPPDGAQPVFDFQLDIDLDAMRYSVRPEPDGLRSGGDYRAAEELYLQEAVYEDDRSAFESLFRRTRSWRRRAIP